MQATNDFSVVYSRWMPALTRYCRSILRSDADAEDAAQNAMLKAMDALERGPTPDRLPPWLHRIARNEAISLMRRREGAVALVDEEHPAGPSVEEVASARHRLAELLSDLQALPGRQREALVLREVDGLAHRQIATHLGITEAAAQQAVLDARRSLHAFEAGRALRCDAIQEWLSAHEHARLRTRGVRAHLRDCGDCRGFSAALGSRPRDLAALMPAIGAGGLLARVIGLFGGGGAGIKAALATGVLATAGAGTLIVPHEGGRAGAPAPARPFAGAPDRGQSVSSSSQLVTAARAVADRRDERARTLKHAMVVPDGRADRDGTRPADDVSTPESAPASPSATPVVPDATEAAAGRPDAGAADGVSATGDKSPRAPVPATTPSPPDLPVERVDAVGDVVTPVVGAVTQTTAATADTVEEVVDEVVGSTGVPELERTVDALTGALPALGN